MVHLSGLDWMNLFNGMTPEQVTSVLIAAALFTVASVLCLAALIAFGVRAGLMAPTATAGVPAARTGELAAFLSSSLAALLAVIAMIFLGLIGGSVFAEFYLTNPLVLPAAGVLTVLSLILFLAGARMAMVTVRRRSSAA